MNRLEEIFAAYPSTLSIEQLAEVLGVEPVTVYRWLRKGALPGYKIGNTWVIYRDEVRDFMAEERANREAHPEG